MPSRLLVALLITSSSSFVGFADEPRNPTEESDDFSRGVAPLLSRFCNDCHGEKNPKAGVTLSTVKDFKRVIERRKTWESVLDVLEARDMPPQGKPRPTEAEYDALVVHLKGKLFPRDCSGGVDPGRITLRRLNRVEYTNTVRDLLGVDTRIADDFPSDDVGYGFDNIGDVLTLPPLLMEKYLAAAEGIAENAIVADSTSNLPVKSFKPFELKATAGGERHGGDGLILATNADVSIPFTAERDGTYYLRVRAYGQQPGDAPVKMSVKRHGKSVREFDVKETEAEPGRFEIRISLKKEQGGLSVAFLNDFFDPRNPNPDARDRNLVLEKIEVAGPIENEGARLPRSHRMILFDRKPGQSDGDYLKAVMERLVTRAYRRPPIRDEADRLVQFVTVAKKNGENLERGVQLAIQALLVSPNFLFKIETDARDRPPGSINPLNDYELATRLSYFLWSSMPDDRLFELARDGKLRDEKVIEEQVSRMLKDRRSRSLIENFFGQWLQLRNLRLAQPDVKRFPEFNESLRAAMLKETETYIAKLIEQDRSILEFLDSSYTYVNSRLARHYGINSPQVGDEFKRVELEGGRRGGVITQASILTITSNPTRTSPVKRGKWILEQILGTPPPPPPPDVPELKEDGQALKGSLRQRMEQHRNNPSCASCHARLDPLGFGLENYDAIGAWRDKEGEFAIDASGTLPNGQSFNGPDGLRKLLAARKDEFARCLIEKMLTYALGRGIEEVDRCTVENVGKSLAAKGYRFSALVTEIVKSDTFRKRKNKGGNS